MCGAMTFTLCSGITMTAQAASPEVFTVDESVYDNLVTGKVPSRAEADSSYTSRKADKDVTRNLVILTAGALLACYMDDGKKKREKDEKNSLKAAV